MRARRWVTALAVAASVAVVVPVGAAGASSHKVTGTLTGPGGFRSQGCAGVISVVGSGTYTAKGMGQGTYAYDACVTNTSPLAFTGTFTFTRRSGATITGVISGTPPGAQPPTFVVTVTGGTRRYVHARGTLTVGTLAQSDSHNCNIRIGICTDWTDTGPIVGRLTHVRRH